MIPAPPSLDDGLGVSREVVGRSKARRQRLVDLELNLVEALRGVGDVAGRIGRVAASCRDVPVLVVVADAGVQRELSPGGPTVLHETAERAQRRVGKHRRVEDGNLIRDAAPEDQLVIPGSGGTSEPRPIGSYLEEVATDFDRVISGEPVRLVPTDARARLKSILVIALVHRRRRAGDDARDRIGRRRFAAAVLFAVTARVIPERTDHHVRDHGVAFQAVPLRLPRAVESSLVSARLPGDEPTHVLDVGPPVEHGEAGEPIPLVYLERLLVREEPRLLTLDASRAIRFEAFQDAVVIAPLPPGDVEPQLVADDASAEIAARVVAELERVAGGNSLRLQIVVDVAALEPVARSRRERGAVKVVAAGLDDAVDGDAARRDRRVVTHRLNRRFFENRIVDVVAALRVGLRIRGDDAVHGLPRLTLLTERAERRLRVGGAAADVEVRPRTGRLLHQTDVAVAAAGDELQRFLRQLRRGRRGGGIDERRSARHGDGLFELSDLELDVDARRETRREADAISANRLKSGEYVLDGVCSDRQRRETVLALRVSHSRH